MLVACWSVKGGSGATVVSVALASMLAESAPGGALVVDLAGDVPAVLGVPEPEGPGVRGWLAAGSTVPADALPRLEVEGPGGVRLLAVTHGDEYKRSVGWRTAVPAPGAGDG